MRKPGRKSVAEISTLVAVNSKPSRLMPPSSLSTGEQSLFIELVNSCSERHFTKADLPVLISFIQATRAAQDMSGDADRFNQWEKAVRLQASLATRLRLTPASRTDAKTIARNLPPEGERPWLMRGRDHSDDDDDDISH